jgi:hypothetical protein
VIAAGTTDSVPVGELDIEGSPRAKSGNIDIGCKKRNKEQSMIKSDLNRCELLKITAGAYAQRRCRA